MRSIVVRDTSFIISCLQALRLESPIYNECADDPEYVQGYLVNSLSSDLQFGAIIDGVGFMLGVCGRQWYDSRLIAQEQLLYVKPEFRHSRNAVYLIRAFEEYAKDRSVCEVHAGATTGLNDTRVLDMYIRLGYERYKSGVRKRI